MRRRSLPQFALAVPELVSVSPNTAVTNTALTLTGRNLSTVGRVTINEVNATFTIVNNYAINITCPNVSATNGTYSIAAHYNSNTVRNKLIGALAFVGVSAPTISSVSPSVGDTDGGWTLTITGTGLTGLSAVTIGGLSATGITVVNSTTATCTVPAS